MYRYYIERESLIDDEDNVNIPIGSERIKELIICGQCAYHIGGYCYVSDFKTGLPCMVRYTNDDEYCSLGDKR